MNPLAKVSMVILTTGFFLSSVVGLFTPSQEDTVRQFAVDEHPIPDPYTNWLEQVQKTQKDSVFVLDRNVEFDQRDRYCMQKNVYHEARGEALAHQKDIVWVTLNRVDLEHYPDNVCEVVWQPSQYSWTITNSNEIPHFPDPIEEQAWYTAGKIVDEVFIQYRLYYPDPTHGADHYHADHIMPHWADPSRITKTSGSHIMYSLYD